MYAGWRDAWRNWPRSLPLRDRTPAGRDWMGLVTVALVQALPAPLLLLGGRALPRPLLALNRLLLLVRLGVLAGTHRAYPGVPPTYWLAPLLDLPAVAAIWASALRRRHSWRGRAYDARMLEGSLP
jgi:dolichol-phosphate mannosyltransferase